MPPVAEETLWGGIPVHQHGATAAFFGSPRAHKSRLVLHLAVHQVLGRPFAGMPVYPKPLKWLILNGENSVARLQHDMSGFAKTLTAEEVKLVGEHVAVTCLESADDGDLLVDVNLDRIIAAISQENPDVLVVDTLPAAIPDELDAVRMRLGLGAIRKACAASSRTPVTVIYIGHSRPGIREEAKATSDPLSFQRGNRVLNGVLRCTWNVRRAEVQLDPIHPMRVGVELIHAKANNGKLLPPAAVVLDEETFQYRHVPEFNHAEWDKTVQRMAQTGETMSPAAKAQAAVAALPSTGERICRLLEANGPTETATLVHKMLAQGIAPSQRAAADKLRQLEAAGSIRMHQSKPNRKAKFYTKEQYAEIAG